jgi:hypothetical protein
LRHTREKPQQRGRGRALRLGLLIFETKTHLVTAGIMIDELIMFPIMWIKLDRPRILLLSLFRKEIEYHLSI